MNQSVIGSFRAEDLKSLKLIKESGLNGNSLSSENGFLENIKNLSPELQHLLFSMIRATQISSLINKEVGIKTIKILYHEDCLKGENNFVYILNKGAKANPEYQKIFAIVNRIKKENNAYSLKSLFLEDSPEIDIELLEADGYSIEI